MPSARPRLLIDINVILDVVLARQPWVDDSAGILDALSQNRAIGFVAGHAITTIYYVVQRRSDRVAATTAVSDLLQICDVVPSSGADFRRALTLGLGDFEDAVTVAAALTSGADYLVTRNGKDFRGVPITVRSPGTVLALLP
jgi:predicted nucleic acid-binding protein